MSKMIECDICNSMFTNISIMNHHKKTARYCLEIQKRDDIPSCTCGRKIASKDKLEEHRRVCLTYLNMKVDELQTKLLLYEGKDVNHMVNNNISSNNSINSDSVSNCNNNTIDNSVTNITIEIKPLTEEHIIEQVAKLTKDHVSREIAGIVEFLLEYPLRGYAVCSDIRRKIVEFKDSDNNIIRDDNNCKKLLKLIFPHLKEDMYDHLKELVTEHLEESNNELTDEQTEQYTKRLDTLNDIREYVRDTILGENNKLDQKISFNLCKGLPRKKTGKMTRKTKKQVKNISIPYEEEEEPLQDMAHEILTKYNEQ